MSMLESCDGNTGILTVTIPSLVNLFGYGCAVLSTVAVTNATTINLFNGATPVGSLSFSGVLAPNFAGGFAGISSALPFNRAQLTFNSVAATAFAVDNVTFAEAASEPSTILLVAAGMGVLLWRRREIEG